MTPRKCPTVLQCPKVWRILEQYGANQKNILDATVVEKVISSCVACIEPKGIVKRDGV